MRNYATGATRDTAEGKPDYKGFLSLAAIKRFGQYMQQHQEQADGGLRASDNWKKGIPIPDYLSSLLRHVINMIDAYEQGQDASAEDLACAVWFNNQGFLHELVMARRIREEVAARPVTGVSSDGREWLRGHLSDVGLE